MVPVSKTKHTPPPVSQKDEVRCTGHLKLASDIAFGYLCLSGQAPPHPPFCRRRILTRRRRTTSWYQRGPSSRPTQRTLGSTPYLFLRLSTPRPVSQKEDPDAEEEDDFLVPKGTLKPTHTDDPAAKAAADRRQGIIRPQPISQVNPFWEGYEADLGRRHANNSRP